MSTFETALKFWWGPLSGGGLRRLPHLMMNINQVHLRKLLVSHILRFGCI